MGLAVGGGKQPFRILQRKTHVPKARCGLVRPALLEDVPMLWAVPEPQKLLLKKNSWLCASLTSGKFPQLPPSAQPQQGV